MHALGLELGFEEYENENDTLHTEIDTLHVTQPRAYGSMLNRLCSSFDHFNRTFNHCSSTPSTAQSNSHLYINIALYTIVNMSHLQYYAYPGVGVENRQKFRYSQAVRVGDRIECAGQGRYSRNQQNTEFMSHVNNQQNPPSQAAGTRKQAFSTRRSTSKSTRLSRMSN